MPGLFDTLMSGGFDDTESGKAAQLALAAGLLGGRGSFGSILGNSLMGAQDTYRSSKKDALSAEMTRSQLDELKRKAEAEARLRAANESFRSQLTSPQMQASQTALAGGGGPTMANASAMPKVDPTQDLMFKAMQSGMMNPLDYVKLTQKETGPKYRDVAAGGSVFDERTGKFIGTAPAKDEAATQVMRLLAERDKFPVNSEPWKVLDAALKKASTHPEPIRIENMQAPQPMWNPETKQFEMVQPSSRRGGAAEPVKTPSGQPYQPPPTKTGADKPIPLPVVKLAQDARDSANTLANLSSSFKDDYGSKGVLGAGANLQLAAGGILGKDKDAVDWWKNYRKQSELVERHELFGSALSAREQSSWKSADVGPEMHPDVIKRNLTTRAELAAKLRDAMRQDLIDAGHDPAKINPIIGRGSETRVRKYNPSTGKLE